ncbi:hypothetical protein F2P81_020470 [Scophthalmus maximus]|uniref:Uncharacterized protein n=1 Tax=Scophthalmus maximus TaxID=52904 RepID=A0A6A4S5A0_SCOMX|nr:hypothetical protein F2P81_020470 [Scophthalmus maximus]
MWDVFSDIFSCVNQQYTNSCDRDAAESAWGHDLMVVMRWDGPLDGDRRGGGAVTRGFRSCRFSSRKNKFKSGSRGEDYSVLKRKCSTRGEMFDCDSNIQIKTFAMFWHIHRFIRKAFTRAALLPQSVVERVSHKLNSAIRTDDGTQTPLPPVDRLGFHFWEIKVRIYEATASVNNRFSSHW